MKFNRDNLGQYNVNSALEAEVGVVYNFAGRKLRLLRAGGSNHRYRRIAQTELSPYSVRIDRKELSYEENTDLMMRIYAKSVIIDWEGVEDEEGNPVPFNTENAYEFFKAFPEIFNDVVEIATNRASFQEQFVREVARELGKS